MGTRSYGPEAKNFEVFAGGMVFGIYTATSEKEARDLCARDAGFASEAEMVYRLGRPSELEAYAIGA